MEERRRARNARYTRNAMYIKGNIGKIEIGVKKFIKGIDKWRYLCYNVCSAVKCGKNFLFFSFLFLIWRSGKTEWHLGRQASVLDL